MVTISDTCKSEAPSNKRRWLIICGFLTMLWRKEWEGKEKLVGNIRTAVRTSSVVLVWPGKSLMDTLAEVTLRSCSISALLQVCTTLRFSATASFFVFLFNIVNTYKFVYWANLDVWQVRQVSCIMGSVGSGIFGDWPILGTRRQVRISRPLLHWSLISFKSVSQKSKSLEYPCFCVLVCLPGPLLHRGLPLLWN